MNMKSKHLLIKLKTMYNDYNSLSFGTFYIFNVLMVKNQLTWRSAYELEWYCRCMQKINHNFVIFYSKHSPYKSSRV